MSERERRRSDRRIHGLAPKEDVERELRAHLALREEELIAAGWDAAAAREQARRLFGDYGAIRRDCSEVAERYARETRRTRMWSDMRQDVRYAFRWLAREPLFALLAIVTLALGIGATTATFGIVDDVLLAPLPYPEPERLVAIREVNEQYREPAVTWPNFQDWRASARSLAATAAYQSFDVTVLGGSEPVRARLARVSGDYFHALGVAPRLGRAFEPEELVPGGQAAVVVSDGFWRRQLGAREDLSSLRLDVAGAAAEVIGVMPPDFDHPRGADLWYPVEREDPAALGTRSAHNFQVLARLAPGVTIAAARAELTALAVQIRERESDSDAIAVAVYGLREYSVGSSRRALFILLGASGFVLLVACTNLASALLARAARRQREIAIRTALGARRLRLLRQLLTESLVLAALGAAAGFGLAQLLITLVTTVGPQAVPRLQDVRLDGWVLAFTTLLAVATALTFGTAPALRATATQPYDALQESGRGTETPRQRRAWSLLVSAEVALALLLLVGSGLLIRSFWNLLQVDPGFRSDATLAVTILLPDTKYATGPDRVRYYDALLERVRGVAGVQHASLTMTVPMVTGDPNGVFDIEGGADGDGDASYRVVSPSFFETTRTPVLRGRAFTPADREGATDVIMINQTMAEQFFPDRDPLGVRMRTGGMDSKGYDFATVIGVVGDVRSSLDRPPEPAYYLTFAQRADRIGSMTLLLRGRGNPARLAAPVRSAIRTIDADVPIEMGTWSEQIGETLAERRFLLLVLGIFAGIALLLAAVGIYGVVAFAVAQRTREIGIRVVLGAEKRTLLWTVTRATMLSVFAGIALGLAGAVLLSRVTASFLFEVDAIDPLTFATVALILTATAWIAVLVPARRATRVSPITALRAE
jgi:putative ABC transport system permease protein